MITLQSADKGRRNQ